MATDFEQKIASLHHLERKLLNVLSDSKGKLLQSAAREAGIEIDQARRAAEWLSSKGFISQSVEKDTTVALGAAGEDAAHRGLPEVRVARYLDSHPRAKLSVRDLSSSLNLMPGEIDAAIGKAKRAGWIVTVSENSSQMITRTERPTDSSEQKLLERLSNGPVEKSELDGEESKALLELGKRPGLIVEKKRKDVNLRLTTQGKIVLSRLGERKGADRITVEMLQQQKPGEYDVKLRPLDVASPAPIFFPGKKHFVQAFVDEIREIFVALGFTEVEGPIVQPTFWNFDALFIPQNHPARDMQDTFYLRGITAKNYASKDIIRKIASVHEDGAGTGSRGWGYEWKVSEAAKFVLRTHTTAVTVKYLADHKPTQARIFSVGKVFRNEKVAYKSLVEFYQIEGIVVGSHVSVRDMMGILSKFYSKLGLSRVKFWPTFFPYTEPSLQAMVFHEPSGKWLEICGMGIFRPEVTLPLGVKNPVPAWGGGLERLIMLRHGITDLRELYRNDLDALRKVNLCR